MIGLWHLEVGHRNLTAFTSMETKSKGYRLIPSRSYLGGGETWKSTSNRHFSELGNTLKQVRIFHNFSILKIAHLDLHDQSNFAIFIFAGSLSEATWTKRSLTCIIKSSMDHANMRYESSPKDVMNHYKVPCILQISYTTTTPDNCSGSDMILKLNCAHI